MNNSSCIRKSPEYIRGFNEGWQDGYNKAMERILEITALQTQPMKIECTPQNGECPILKNNK
jgi:hypothetical protein